METTARPFLAKVKAKESYMVLLLLLMIPSVVVSISLLALLSSPKMECFSVSFFFYLFTYLLFLSFIFFFFFPNRGILTYDQGNAFRELKNVKLFPSIGMKKHPGSHVKANFGQFPFIFDIDGMVAVSLKKPQTTFIRHAILVIMLITCSIPM